MLDKEVYDIVHRNKKWLHRMFGKPRKNCAAGKDKEKLSRADKKQIEAAIARANRTDKKENLRRTVSLMNGCGRTESADGSPCYINPMDLNLDYSDDDNPLSLKSDFILSLCELIVGGKDGLAPVEKTIIDRCVRIVYRDYLNDPKPENMPLLEDLYNALRAQDEKKRSTSPLLWKSTSPAR